MQNLSSLGKRLATFSGGTQGPWQVVSITPVKGDSLPDVKKVLISHGATALPIQPSWSLNGVASNHRYTEQSEKDALVAIQAGLGRPEATCAALIPIRKSPAWWELSQEKRRAIFETESHHIASSLKYLPAISRQLYHSRDLGEPFDFLTWFEYAPAHATDFEELVRHLRGTLEWTYVDREIDVRLRLE